MYFDFEELERIDMKAMRTTLSPIQLKAMAMKFRHNALGFKFKGQHRKASIDGTRSLTEPLAPVPEDKLNQSDQDVRFPSEPEVDAMDRNPSTLEVRGTANWIGIKGIILHPFCTFLICSPLGIVSGISGKHEALTFWLNFLALVPLAKILGDATEELAASIQNDTLSGLLNATFGNAVEVIVSVQSIRAGLFTVVKASLLGSVLSNILLVLGMSFFLGGLTPNKAKRGKFHSFQGSSEVWRRRYVGMEKEQKFSVKSAMISMAMLFFACMVVVLPTLFNALPDHDTASVLQVSRIGAWITLSCYLMYLIFQLLTHSVTLSMSDKLATSPPSNMPLMQADFMADDEEEEEESASIDASVAIIMMAAVTVLVALNSQFLVAVLQRTVELSGLPMGFIGVILLPVAGNACEHASAVRFCMRDRPGLAIGIAVGSATQVALLVIPLSVLLAQMMGQPLDLDFGILNVAVVSFTLIVVVVLLLDGRSNWFKGYVLCAMYFFIAALYLYIPPGFGLDAAPVTG